MTVITSVSPPRIRFKDAQIEMDFFDSIQRIWIQFE